MKYAAKSALGERSLDLGQNKHCLVCNQTLFNKKNNHEAVLKGLKKVNRDCDW